MQQLADKGVGVLSHRCERPEIARRRAEEEGAEAFFLCERRRSRRIPRAVAQQLRGQKRDRYVIVVLMPSGVSVPHTCSTEPLLR
jgi:hypothetical protein